MDGMPISANVAPQKRPSVYLYVGIVVIIAIIVGVVIALSGKKKPTATVSEPTVVSDAKIEKVDRKVDKRLIESRDQLREAVEMKNEAEALSDDDPKKSSAVDLAKTATAVATASTAGALALKAKISHVKATKERKGKSEKPRGKPPGIVRKLGVMPHKRPSPKRPSRPSPKRPPPKRPSSPKRPSPKKPRWKPPGVVREFGVMPPRRLPSPMRPPIKHTGMFKKKKFSSSKKKFSSKKKSPPSPMKPPIKHTSMFKKMKFSSSKKKFSSKKKSPPSPKKQPSSSGPSLFGTMVKGYFDYHNVADPSLKATRSDERLKSDLVKVGELRGFTVYSWTWNYTAKLLYGLTGKDVGVLAQDLPETVVETDKNGYLFIKPDTWVTSLLEEVKNTYAK